jgi:MAF protein
MLESPIGTVIPGKNGGFLTAEPILMLASNSPRRKQLLSLADWMFNIVPADVDETPLPGEAPDSYVLRLAEAKARAAAAQGRDGQVILSADTTVADQGRILGKPEDANEAMQMLKGLRGRSHQVFTAIAAYRPEQDQLYTDLAATDVPMRDYTDQEIETYIETGDPFDKAGSYAIQHPEFKPVDHLSGCYANVVGLPLCHLVRTLRKLDIQPENDVPAACQLELGYDCPVYPKVLKGEL